MKRPKVSGSELWWLVGSGGFTIWVLSTSSQKSSIGWPQNSLRHKVCQILVKNLPFDDSFHKKGQILVILVPGIMQQSESVNILMIWGCWGHWGCWGCWVHWCCRGSKAWKITTEDFRVISFCLLFWNLHKIWIQESIDLNSVGFGQRCIIGWMTSESCIYDPRRKV